MLQFPAAVRTPYTTNKHSFHMHLHVLMIQLLMCAV
jgi:hypothetical protein